MAATNNLFSCPACDKAVSNPLYGEFWSQCIECQARQMAGSPVAFNAINKVPGAARQFNIDCAVICPHDVDGFKACVRRWYDTLHPAGQRDLLSGGPDGAPQA